jgi:hypothetical protein
LSRSLQRLMERGLIAYCPTYCPCIGTDYVLTDSGVQTGSPLEVEVDLLYTALGAFEMIEPDDTFVAKCRERYPTVQRLEGYTRHQFMTEGLKRLAAFGDRANGWCRGEIGRASTDIENGYRRPAAEPHQPIVETVDEVESRDSINLYAGDAQSTGGV